MPAPELPVGLVLALTAAHRGSNTAHPWCLLHRQWRNKWANSAARPPGFISWLGHCHGLLEVTYLLCGGVFSWGSGKDQMSPWMQALWTVPGTQQTLWIVNCYFPVHSDPAFMGLPVTCIIQSCSLSLFHNIIYSFNVDLCFPVVLSQRQMNVSPISVCKTGIQRN